MLKKTITYTDFNGDEVVEEYYFNMSKSELAELELKHNGGFRAYLQRVVDSQNGELIVETFKDIILKSVGRRSEDGKRFIKDEQISREFMQTNAYDILFMELVTDANAAAAFVRGIVPADLGEKLPKKLEDVELPQGDDPVKDEEPEWLRENREPTKKELIEASPEQLREAFRRRTIRDTQ